MPSLPRIRISPGPIVAIGLVLHLLTGCSSPEERSARHLQNARDYLATDQVALANVEVRNALRLAPDDADAHYLQAQVLTRQEDWMGARSSLERATALRPAFAPAQRDLARIYLLRGEFDSAESATQAALALAPDDAGTLALLAAIKLRQGDPEAARGAAEAARSAVPDHPEAMAVLAAAALADGDREAAGRILEEAIAANPTDLTLHLMGLQFAEAEGDVEVVMARLQALTEAFPERIEFYQALAAYQAGRPDAGPGGLEAAAATLERAVARNPDSTTARIALAELLGATDPARGVESLRALVARGSPDPLLDLALAALYVRQGDDPAAAALLESVAGRERGSVGIEARTELARLTLRAADAAGQERAIALVEEILALDPGNAEALSLRARLHLDAGHFEAAQVVANALVQAQPGAAEGYALAGEAYLGQQLDTLARERLVRALEIDPGHSRAARQLATMHLRDGSPARAAQILERATLANPGSAVLAQALLDLQVQTEAIPAAIETARRILALAPEAPHTRLVLASLLERAGESEAAMLEYEALLAAEPANVIAANNLASLLLKTMTDEASARRALTLSQPLAGRAEAPFLDTAGWSRLANGDYAGALELLERAAGAAPESGEIACHLALARYRAGIEAGPQSARAACAGATDDVRLQRWLAELPAG
ncbi:MAG: tetratricopeptide repeat protein [Pseudomonadales bacterium]|nr:tetratricopeptide repeat protein [Pseudomonadales bacterium]